MKRIKILTALTITLAIFICGCSQTSPAPSQDESESENTTSEPDNTSETAAQEQETTTEPEAPAEAVPNNWYVEGYEVPENWIAVMTHEEAFECFDELVAETQEGKTVEEIVTNLVNRNILVFEIFHGRGFERKNANISSYDVPQPISSDYFDSVEDLVELVNGTYTASMAAEIYRSDDGKPAAFFEQDGELYVDFNKTPIWSTQPFNWQTYLEFISADDNTCTFIWHYVTWEYFDYEYNDTDEIYSHHYGMTFHAVRENGEWRLTSTIFDNPGLDQA